MSNFEYRFIDKDPVIDVIRTVMGQQGNISNEQINRVAYDSGVSPTTIHNWLNGDTRRPLSLSTRFVLQALGVKIVYRREEDGTEVRQAKPTLISAAEQRKILAKDRERERARAAK